MDAQTAAKQAVGAGRNGNSSECRGDEQEPTLFLATKKVKKK